MLKILPLCRKEKYFTSCILPQLICGDFMQRLNHFLNFLNINNKFIHENYSLDNLLFYTEYSLKESADWIELLNHSTKETPDLVLLIKSRIDNSHLLVVIEAKMYNRTSAKKFREQLDLQKPIIEIIKGKIGIKEEDILHIGLLKDIPKNLVALENEQIITWSDILKLYPDLKENYFYKILDFAITNDKVSSPLKKGAHSQTKRKQNYFDKCSYDEIKKLSSKEGSKIIIGFTGGRNALKVADDVELEKRIFKWDYVESSKGKKNKGNWIYGDEFYQIVTNK